MKILCWLGVLAVAAMFVAGCGGSGDAETASGSKDTQATREEMRSPDLFVSLDGRVGAENVGILIAKERGYFTDLGFKVGLGAPGRPRRPIWYVSNRTVDIALAQQPQVVLAKEKRAPVIAVGSLQRQPTLSFIWLPGSHVHSIADLKGKTIGVPGIPYEQRFLQLLLARSGLSRRDVHIKIVGYDLVRTLESGQADAIFGSSNLEGAVLAQRGLNPVIVPVRRLGIPDYDELVVIVRSRRAARNPRLIHKFMAAVNRGTAAAIADPEAAVRMIEENEEKGYDLSHEDIKAEVEATLPLLSRNTSMRSTRVRHLVDWMQEQHLIHRSLPVSELAASYQK